MLFRITPKRGSTKSPRFEDRITLEDSDDDSDEDSDDDSDGLDEESEPDSDDLMESTENSSMSSPIKPSLPSKPQEDFQKEGKLAFQFKVCLF